MPIACLAVPAFSLACELAAHPALQGEPVALADPAGLRVVEATPAAARRGVRPGMTLREAVGFDPRLAVLEPHPARHDATAAACVDALAAVSPTVEQEAPGLVYADLRGLDRLYPNLATLERAIRAHTPKALQPRLGVAGRRFTAYAAARAAPPNASLRVADDEAAAFLAPQPIDWLPLDHEALARLRLLGLDTLGAFAKLPRHAVEAQFGKPGGRAWDAAHGRDATPLLPRAYTETLSETLHAEPPLVSQEAIRYSMRQLLSRLLRHPDLAGRFVRALRLQIVAEDDRVWDHRPVLKEPTSDRDRLWLAIRIILDRSHYSAPIVRLTLELAELTAESGQQTVLFPGRIRDSQRLDEMVRQLKTRYGNSPIKQLVEVEPWNRIPERRYGLMDYDP